MRPQTIERRVESLEDRVARLEELPARVDDLTGQILQLRGEMASAFSAMSARIDGLPEAIMSQVRVLHEDVVDRLKIIQEGQAPRPRSGARKKR